MGRTEVNFVFCRAFSLKPIFLKSYSVWMSVKLDSIVECYASSHTSGAEQKDVSVKSRPIGEDVHPLSFHSYKNVYHTLIAEGWKWWHGNNISLTETLNFIFFKKGFW